MTVQRDTLLLGIALIMFATWMEVPDWAAGRLLLLESVLPPLGF
jgi:hypothetical protein